MDASLRMSFGSALLLAQLAGGSAPSLNSINPPGGQRGTDLEVTLSGERLVDAREFVFYQPGIQCLQITSTTNDNVKAMWRLATNCPLGEFPFRIHASSGVTEVRTFFVGPFTNLAEVEPNNEPTAPQSLPAICTVNATGGGEDADYYLVPAKKGQRLSVEVEGVRLGRAHLDTSVRVLAPNGQVLAAADDVSLLYQDPTISLIAPEDTNYLVHVHDSTFNGPASAAYRLHVGAFPRPLAVFPAGGRTGETVSVTFHGDAGGVFTQAVALPITPQERWPVFAEKDGLTAPSPNWMRVSALTNVLESEPNDTLEKASRAPTAPAAFNGAIGTPGDADWFKFNAKKGAAFEFQVYARRLRSPLDAVLVLSNAKGETLTQNDDTAGLDSSFKWTAPADGDYYISVTDHLRRGGPDYVYRVEIESPAPSVLLSIPQVARNDSQSRQMLVVPKGGHFGTVISVKRNQVDGPLQLELPGLPAGLTLDSDPLPPGSDTWPMVLSAKPDAPLKGKLLDLVARGVTNNTNFASAYRHQVEFVPGPNNTFYHQLALNQLYVAVADPVPFAIHVVPPSVPVVQNGPMDLAVQATRASGFEEPIKLQMLWNPPGISSVPEVTIPKGATSAVYRINAAPGAEPKAWKIAMLASATVNGGTVFISSPMASLRVSEPYLLGKFEPFSGPPGQTARLVCKLEQKRAFTGNAKLKLEGLPDKATAPEITITHTNQEAVFAIEVGTNCPPGSYRNLVCTADVPESGQMILHTVAGGGTLRIVPPKPPTLAAKEAKAP